MIRLAVAAALLAAVLSGAALAVALTRPVAPRWPLVCGEQFRDAQTGGTVPMYVPCSQVRP